MVIHHYNAATALITMVHVRWLQRIAQEAFSFDYLVNSSWSPDRHPSWFPCVTPLLINQRIKVHHLVILLGHLTPRLIIILRQLPPCVILLHLFWGFVAEFLWHILFVGRVYWVGVWGEFCRSTFRTEDRDLHCHVFGWVIWDHNIFMALIHFRCFPEFID